MSITSNTRVTLTIGGIALAVFSLVGATWRVANALNDIKKEMTDLRRDISAVAAERWSTSDMERWAYRLERSNRDKLLIVPDVRSVREERAMP